MARQTRRSTRQRDSRYDTRDDVKVPETNTSLLQTWQVTSFLSIIIPIILFSLCHLFGRGEWNRDRDDDAGPSRGVVIFTYLVSLFLFLALVANGNAFLSTSHAKKRKYWYVLWRGVHDAERSAQDLGLLTGALLMFSCFAFLLFLVSASFLMNFERMENFKESFNQMAMIIPFTFLLWSIFCGSFGYSFFLTNPGDFTTDAVDIGNETNVTEDEAQTQPASSSSKTTLPFFSVKKTQDSKSTNDSKAQPLV